MFYMYGVKKMSLRDLFNEMKSRGYKKTLTSIRKMLHDVSYCGDPSKGTRGENSFYRKYPAIVSRELFDTVQKRTDEAKHDNRKTDREILGKKIVKCPKCGHAMVMSSLGRYACNWHTKRQYVYDPCDNTCTIDKTTVDKLLWGMSKKIWKWKMREHNDEEKKRMVDEMAVSLEKMKVCDKELAQIETRMKRAKDLYILGDLGDKEFESYRISINGKKIEQAAQKARLEERIAYLNECIVGLNDPEESDIEKAETDFETKDRIVHECIKEITVDYIDDKKRDKVIKVKTIYNESFWLKRYQKRDLERIVWDKRGWARVPKRKEEDF
jgi:hypothetical protein